MKERTGHGIRRPTLGRIAIGDGHEDLVARRPSDSRCPARPAHRASDSPAASRASAPTGRSPSEARPCAGPRRAPTPPPGARSRRHCPRPPPPPRRPSSASASGSSPCAHRCRTCSPRSSRDVDPIAFGRERRARAAAGPHLRRERDPHLDFRALEVRRHAVEPFAGPGRRVVLDEIEARRAPPTRSWSMSLRRRRDRSRRRQPAYSPSACARPSGAARPIRGSRDRRARRRTSSRRASSRSAAGRGPASRFGEFELACPVSRSKTTTSPMFVTPRMWPRRVKTAVVSALIGSFSDACQSPSPQRRKRNDPFDLAVRVGTRRADCSRRCRRRPRDRRSGSTGSRRNRHRDPRPARASTASAGVPPGRRHGDSRGPRPCPS